MPLSLLHPALFAIGALCVGIPIVLHLLRRKRRPIAWGAMRFLEEAYKKRRRIITIEQLILLALRCLLVLLIALGVGSLMLGTGPGAALPVTMIVVLDDSIGSGRTSEGASGLERARRFALAALDELDSARGDTAALISASRPGEGVVIPASNDLGAVRAQIQRQATTDARADPGAAMELAASVRDQSDRASRRVLVLAGATHEWAPSATSDENQSRLSVDRVLALAPAAGTAENIGISAVSATRSLVTGAGVRLPLGVRVELLRSGEMGARRATRIVVRDHLGAERGSGRVDWAPGERSRSVVIAINSEELAPAAARSALLEARIDEDANARDNIRLLPLPTRGTLRVGVIDRAGPRPETGDGVISPSRWARAALAPTEGLGIGIMSIEASRAAALLTPELDAVLVLAPGAVDEAGWSRIARLNESGALVVITPDAQTRAGAWVEHVRALEPSLLGAGADAVEHDPPLTLSAEIPDHSVLAGIAPEMGALAPAVSVPRSLTLGEGGGEALAGLLLSDGSALLVQREPDETGRGMIALLSVALDLSWSDLPTRPLFVAMMQEIVRQGVGLGAAQRQITAGDRLPTPVWARRAQRPGLGRLEANTDASPERTSIAGVVTHLDAQGAARAMTVINPDSEGANARAMTREQMIEQIGRLVDASELRLVGGPEPEQAGANGDEALLGEDAPSTSLALWALLGAAIIALLELVLARLFTARLLDTIPPRTGTAR